MPVAQRTDRPDQRPPDGERKSKRDEDCAEHDCRIAQRRRAKVVGACLDGLAQFRAECAGELAVLFGARLGRRRELAGFDCGRTGPAVGISAVLHGGQQCTDVDRCRSESCQFVEGGRLGSRGGSDLDADRDVVTEVGGLDQHLLRGQRPLCRKCDCQAVGEGPDAVVVDRSHCGRECRRRARSDVVGELSQLRNRRCPCCHQLAQGVGSCCRRCEVGGDAGFEFAGPDQFAESCCDLVETSGRRCYVGARCGRYGEIVCATDEFDRGRTMSESSAAILSREASRSSDWTRSAPSVIASTTGRIKIAATFYRSGHAATDQAGTVRGSSLVTASGSSTTMSYHPFDSRSSVLLACRAVEGRSRRIAAGLSHAPDSRVRRATHR